MPLSPLSSIKGTQETFVATGTQPQNIPSAIAFGQPSLSEGKIAK